MNYTKSITIFIVVQGEFRIRNDNRRAEHKVNRAVVPKLCQHIQVHRSLH